MNRTLQSANAEKLEPGHRCLQFDVAADETCRAVWEEWKDVCINDVGYWGDECEAVDTAWYYDQDLDW